MNLETVLQYQGLNPKEAKIYLVLLELQEALPSVISKRAGIKRPTTYVILEQLQKKGLISHVKRGGNLYFRALNPKSFVQEQGQKLKWLEEALPDLSNLNRKYASTPQMSVFEGKEGLIQIMEDTLTTSTGLLCWANISVAVHTLLEDYYPLYIKKKVKNKVFLKGIFPYEKRSLEFKKRGEKELREVHLIPADKFPFKNEINIYDDKVAIISHQDETGVIIQNQSIADTQRVIFNLGFEYAKLLEKDLLTKDDLRYLVDEDD
ncbi:MAG: helix-turn-helix domain-containing protein [Patescibacteria group bacterium]